MKVLDLFSGIGGFSLGLERAGFETVTFCEIEPYCRAVLRKHWPNVPIFEDIRELTGEQIGPVDVICGGYPCQPFSQAGQRRGEEDHRHLWPEFSRLVAELRPAWVIGENVAGHISMGLDDVLSDLEGQGYTCRPFVVPACAVDAPHRRDRVWIVGHADVPRHDRTEKPGLYSQTAGARVSNNACHASGTGSMAHTNDSGRKQQWGDESVRTEQPALECGSRWQPESGICRVAHGIPNRVHRLRALGNAVVPQIPEMIGRAIMKADLEFLSQDAIDAGESEAQSN